MQPTTADKFIDLACLLHNGNDAVARREQAAAILEAAPWLVRDGTYVAAAVGDVRSLREHLDRGARRGGPRGWDALLYLCNARLAPRASVIRSRAPAFCSIGARILRLMPSYIKCHTRPSQVLFASARQVRLRRRHTHR